MYNVLFGSRWDISPGFADGIQLYEAISPELRETIILRDLQDMEYREIADVLEIPEGTVKSRLNRGRAELARILKKHREAF